MFNFHTHQHTNNGIQNVDDITSIHKLSSKFLSIGNHPWRKAYSILQIEKSIKTYTNIISIGECGLDKTNSFYDIDKQINILKEQTILSEKLKLPLTLHIVKSFNELIKLKKEIKPTQKWIIHGFNTYKHSQVLIENGFYLSFGTTLLTNEKLQNEFRAVPLNKIFLETDDSDLKIEKIYTFASKLKLINDTQLSNQITKNLNTITNGKLA